MRTVAAFDQGRGFDLAEAAKRVPAMPSEDR